MALQSFANNFGAVICPVPPGDSGVANLAIDAAGESLTFIGRVNLQGGAGSSKTISSSGGKIHWHTGITTFADSGTTLRLGIQDVGATGLEDGTFDVHADLVGATDTIAGSSIISTAMESGTKTITHGDLIAISFELISRAGADSIAIRRNQQGRAFPYFTSDTGSGPAKTATQGSCATIEFDDGTVGWIGEYFLFPGFTQTLFQVNSTPDERALIFQVPFPCTVSGVIMNMTSVASTDNFEVIAYSDPLGTPVAEVTHSFDADLAASASQSWFQITFATNLQVTANTKYAIAIRPTTTNTIAVSELVYGTGNEKLLRPTALGENWYSGTRSNQSGAFSETTTTLPLIGLFLSKFDDGTPAHFV